MGALAHLLTSKPGRHAEFIRKAEVVVSGMEPHAMALMQAGPTLQRTGIPLIWIHPTEEIHLLRIGLAALCGGQSYYVENCMLWMAPGADRAYLVPDDFNLGAFVFKNDLKLRYSRRAPAASFKDAMPGMAAPTTASSNYRSSRANVAPSSRSDEQHPDRSPRGGSCRAAMRRRPGIGRLSFCGYNRMVVTKRETA